MKTEAVICIAFTSTKPSRTPLSLRQSVTWPVILTKPRRAGTSNQSSLRKVFTVNLRLQGMAILGADSGRVGFVVEADSRLVESVAGADSGLVGAGAEIDRGSAGPEGQGQKYPPACPSDLLHSADMLTTGANG